MDALSAGQIAAEKRVLIAILYQLDQLRGKNSDNPLLCRFIEDRISAVQEQLSTMKGPRRGRVASRRSGPSPRNRPVGRRRAA